MNKTEITVDATKENYPNIVSFVEEALEKNDCSMKAQMQIDVAVDEVFTNIMMYAYEPEIGKATVSLEFTESPKTVVIQFVDSGKPFDPLKKEDPDITLSAEERDIGGLGIFMVKKIMNDVSYEYKDGQNILTIKKIIE